MLMAATFIFSQRNSDNKKETQKDLVVHQQAAKF